MTTKLLRYSDVIEMIGMNRRTIWKWVKLGKFPEPVRMNGRTIGWRCELVQQWVEENQG
ncbi:AlpA family phage regulatory protein [Vibrio sp. 1CM2L]|uniref:helix-turn-helix transcriptional regulator n=1 Tax=Vibrio sp. 1CM2L TaxID=2929166 RepID=UPI0020BF601C|nr:AlpA family phage regulatory protein [Vibrio sp. 1CM2L]MCK8078338.1 AlpA family phage regulatory protein [Vibrio sp. 1CM2L]